jgi:hypothetical protein
MRITGPQAIFEPSAFWLRSSFANQYTRLSVTCDDTTLTPISVHKVQKECNVPKARFNFHQAEMCMWTLKCCVVLSFIEATGKAAGTLRQISPGARLRPTLTLFKVPARFLQLS